MVVVRDLLKMPTFYLKILELVSCCYLIRFRCIICVEYSYQTIFRVANF
jgi:hypothetical protein